ncbi:voltage-gated potassium channel [Bimuria novae-zelandiae CBS 107.79]|uniref:Voltage-gated potassium channel n=1 Tax=Bimuria novae-zelandiae CBS 107.79 TaxID=1447943 RepID=A0A6A5VGB0_9PLEO|nr:voltage-gated potassium channel [Bimuria novae-zelandiae CBS 107.79]
MNDPGLEEPAQQAAEDVEKNVYEEDKKKAEAEEQDFLDPRQAAFASRWWFASTACPLIAGTFGPIANAFSICALVEKWRVYIPLGSDEGHGSKVEDPKWLVAVNSISLVFALAANIALLLNMTRRLSFAIAQPITIIGWFLASFLLIALVAVASTNTFRIQPTTQHALSQAFYYGIMAAGLYFIIASLMIMTVYGAYRGHYPKEFRLTPSQRTLMLQTISFMFYLLLGAFIFSKVEGWNFLDAVYWADFTLLTVGVGGEFVPKTHTGRTLLFFYAFGGIVSLGLVIGSIRSLVLERGKEKMAARFTEIKRRKVVASIDDENRKIRLGWFEKIEFSEKGLDEAQRREQEFNVMRRIQEKAEGNRRYTALAMSSTAAFLLWFLGAVVFMNSEKPQGWSYFVSLYFSFTSLMTIGYGDISPTSNSGKAFFVFWTLLAVPTLTILISNMGNTVIKAFRDLTIWVGSITVLPDDHGARGTLKVGFQRLKRGKLYNGGREGGAGTRDTGAAEKMMQDRLAEHIEEDELAEADEAGEHGDSLERDVHFYHYILAKELRHIMRDVDASPPKQYTYQEWNYYLRLIGQNENNASAHRKPRIHEERKPNTQPDLGTADEGEGDKWSWLGVRSPLMGNASEAEWLLQRISATLEREMLRIRDPRARKEPPPISMADLRSSEGKTGADPEQDLKKDIGAAEIRRRAKHDM